MSINNNKPSSGRDFKKKTTGESKDNRGKAESKSPRSNPYARKPRSEYKERPEIIENKIKELKENRIQRTNVAKAGISNPKTEQKPTTDGLRLNRFIANAGVCSRREADLLIQKGLISVNGSIVTELGTIVKTTDKIIYNQKELNCEKKVYVLINKPKDVVTTKEDEHSRLTVLDLVRNACEERIYPVGRLDKNTTGVLLLTNDGDLTKQLTHPKFEHKKIYHVFLDKPVTKAHMEAVATGIKLEDGPIKADYIEYVGEDKHQVGIEIHSGRNRIVRRIFESLGYKVEKLDRVYFAGLTKKNLKRGQWRYLSETEVKLLKAGMLT